MNIKYIIEKLDGKTHIHEMIGAIYFNNVKRISFSNYFVRWEAALVNTWGGGGLK